MVRPFPVRGFLALGLSVAALLGGGPAPVAASDAVAPRVAHAISSRTPKGVRLSAAVWDATTGERLHATNASTPRRPASVLKIATTAAAMLALGPAHELATEVVAPSSPDSAGRLVGPLVVRGGGDPGISNRNDPTGAERALREMAKSVLASGIRRVEGDLVLDDTAFQGPLRPPGWGWKPGEYASYMAPVTALTLTDGCLELTVLPGEREGAAAALRTNPTTTAVTLVNRVTTVADRKRHVLSYARQDDEGRLPVVGAIWQKSTGFEDCVACVDPAELFGDVFLRLLREEGVEVTGSAVVVRSPVGAAGSPTVRSVTGGEVVARHATTVHETVRITNTRSQNLYAELLLRALGRASGDGSCEGGCSAVRKALGFAEDDATFLQVDGCGLSRESSVTVDAIGGILLRMYRSPHGREFVGSLARGGDPEGTLRTRFRDQRFRDRVFAKTGTLRDTSALAGYVRGESGRTYAFVILCEGDPGGSRAVQDAVVAALVGS